MATTYTSSRNFSPNSFQSFGDTTFLDGKSGYSMISWVNYASINNNQGGICGKRTSFGDFSFYHYTDVDKFACSIANTGGTNKNIFESTSTISSLLGTGVWGCWAATYTSSPGWQVYLNLVSVPLTAVVNDSVTAINNSTANYEIGGFTDVFGMDGNLAYIQLFSRAISLGEIAECMYCPGSIRNGLVSFVPLLDGTSTVVDKVQNTTATSSGTNISSVLGPPIKSVRL